jgi:predicted MPP superfamily phosphohydrolase
MPKIPRKVKRRHAAFAVIILAVISLSVIVVLYFNDMSRLSTGLVNRPALFKVAAAGDWGCGSDTDMTVTNIKAKDPRIILALGDFGYQEAEDFPGHKCLDGAAWASTMKPIKKNLLMVVGNHDLTEKKYPDLLNKYLEYFGRCTPLVGCLESYYSFNLHRVHFLILNSEFGWRKGTPQYLFADNDLSKASSDTNTDWIVVAYHSARYASISAWLKLIFNTDLSNKYLKPYDDNNYDSLSKDFVNTYHPLFDKYGVDIVLQGHVHNYQRTYPLNYVSPDKPPERTSTTKDVYFRPNGQIYLTVGTGGVELNPVEPEHNIWISSLGHQSEPNDDYYIVKSDYSHYGFLEIQFSPYRKAVLGTFYGNDVLNKGSIVLDQFSIIK